MKFQDIEKQFEEELEPMFDILDGKGNIKQGKVCYGPPCKGADIKMEQMKQKSITLLKKIYKETKDFYYEAGYRKGRENCKKLCNKMEFVECEKHQVISNTGYCFKCNKIKE